MAVHETGDGGLRGNMLVDGSHSGIALRQMAEGSEKEKRITLSQVRQRILSAVWMLHDVSIQIL